MEFLSFSFTQQHDGGLGVPELHQLPGYSGQWSVLWQLQSVCPSLSHRPVWYYVWTLRYHCTTVSRQSCCIYSHKTWTLLVSGCFCSRFSQPPKVPAANNFGSRRHLGPNLKHVEVRFLTVSFLRILWVFFVCFYLYKSQNYVLLTHQISKLTGMLSFPRII